MGEPMAKPRHIARDFCAFRIGTDLKARLRVVAENSGISPSRIARVALARIVSAMEAGQHIAPDELARDMRADGRPQFRREPDKPASQLTLTGVDKVKRSKK